MEMGVVARRDAIWGGKQLSAGLVPPNTRALVLTRAAVGLCPPGHPERRSVPL